MAKLEIYQKILISGVIVILLLVLFEPKIKNIQRLHEGISILKQGGTDCSFGGQVQRYLFKEFFRGYVYMDCTLDKELPQSTFYLLQTKDWVMNGVTSQGEIMTFCYLKCPPAFY